MWRLPGRMLRATLLDWRLYEEVESDSGATIQAAIVVLLASLAAAVGSSAGISSLALHLILHLLAWSVWALLAFWIGTRILPESQTRSDPGELLRTIGFAGSPGILRFFGVIPMIRMAVFWITAVWMLAAMVIAVRQALDYRSTLRAFLVCGLGFLVQALVLLLATTTVS